MFSHKRSILKKNKKNNISAEEEIKNIVNEINNNYKYALHLDVKSPPKIKTLVKNRSNLSTINIKSNKNKSLTRQSSLTFQLKNKITKESLIMELREELKYHLKFNLIYKNFLTRVIQLKELVKENKEKVEQNSNLLKQEFKDRFDLIDQYEKTISLLDVEKKDIVKTNKEILEMREQSYIKLKEQFNEVQEQNNQQSLKIEELAKKIKLLEYKKEHIQEEMTDQLLKDEKNYESNLKSYKTLVNKYEYFLEEYNTYKKCGDEITKEEVKLFDNTNAKNSLIEENLEVQLNEELIKKSTLMNKMNNLKIQIKELEEKQKEEQLKEEKKNYYKKIGLFKSSKMRTNSTFAKSTKNNKYRKKLNFE